MLDFFDKIIGYLETVWNLVVGFVESMLMAVKFLLTGTDAVLYLVGFLPSIIGSCVAIFLAISLIKFILGR